MIAHHSVPVAHCAIIMILLRLHAMCAQVVQMLDRAHGAAERAPGDCLLQAVRERGSTARVEVGWKGGLGWELPQQLMCLQASLWPHQMVLACTNSWHA